MQDQASQLPASSSGLPASSYPALSAKALLELLVPPLLLLASAFPLHAAGRQRVLLDAGWRFHRGEVPGAEIKLGGTPVTHWRWLADDTSAADAGKMAAPDLDTTGGDWKDAATGDDTFHGRVGFAWFRTVLPQVSGSAPTLHFDGVDDNATVYLNGQKLTSHMGWDDPFDVDLKPAWKSGGPNLLAVRVENTAGPGGITAPVSLQEHQGYEATGPALAGFDDQAWRTVHLPHDFIVEGKFSPDADRNHGFLPTTTGWYRKVFKLPAADQGRALWLDFDGIYRDSLVWLNGHFLGRHLSGYTSFRYDISQAANFGAQNVLAVHVDPRHFEGWWYEGGGIYRHVWLNVADPLHVAPWGAFVTSDLPEPKPGASAGPATVHIQTRLVNDGTADTDATLVSKLLDDQNKPVATASTPVAIGPGQSRELQQQVVVAHPRLWSLETPHMYRLVTTLQRGRHAIDQVTTPFGIRTIRFDANHGFFLNGKPVKIQGTCNHQDFAGLGIAVPDTLEYWRVKTLQQMGANAWRMSHNPPTPSLLDACDRLGMLVMDENRHLGDSTDNLAEVASMVLRDRNHPSIIMWSMCNEQPQAGTEAGGRVFAAMKDTVLKYDRTRPVSSAMNSGWFGHGFTDVEDLMGVNYNIEVYDRFHRQHPTLPMFASETASTTTTRGEYANNRQKAYVTSYHMTDTTWRSVAERPFMAGSFVWTGFDYKGEPTPYDWPSINSHFGIMDICGFPKDNYYYYLSWWKPQPVVHLMPHWNWPDKGGQDIKVIAFSNCPKVELLLNGQSLGAKDMPRYGHLEWTVQYAPGILSARGFDAQDLVVATDDVPTTGQPAALRLSASRTTLAADSEDLVPVEVDVLDANGRIVPTANNLVTFKVEGAGHIAGVGNGDAGDHDPDKANFRHAFNGKCLVIVGAGDKRGSIRLIATAPGLKSAALPLRAVKPSKTLGDSTLAARR
jgi:beta-galactosidase